MLDFLFPKMLGRLHKMSVAFDRLIDEVTETRTAVDSILVFAAGIAEQLREAAGDEAKVNDLANQLDTMQADIAAAVTANTPEEPEVPVDPVDEPPVDEAP